MDSALNAVLKQLEAFVPSKDDGETTRRLYDIFEGFGAIPGREAAMAAILALLERFPDAELGTPGPLVHELEALSGYEPHLRGSLRRQPTSLTVWMVNRLLNSRLADDERSAWLTELRAVLVHPRASEETKRGAEEFLVVQGQSLPS